MEMLDLLKMLKNEHGALSVKAEFEAEGTRTDELLRLVDLARRADLKVALKIGGCEAVRDLMESKQFGVEYIIAPMVETPYALSKFINAKNTVYSEDQQRYTDFLFNLETGTTFENLDQMLELAAQEKQLQGVVFGRVDFTASIGKSRENINTAEVTDFLVDAAQKTKSKKLDFVVGGGVAIESLDELARVEKILLSRFETRKVIFTGAEVAKESIQAGLKSTVYFELLWLKNKQKYYSDISLEDASRIKMLDARWTKLSN